MTFRIRDTVSRFASRVPEETVDETVDETVEADTDPKDKKKEPKKPVGPAVTGRRMKVSQSSISDHF